MDSNLLARADAIVGDRIEALVRLHHRRRLARAGWGRALEPSARLWADGDPPPRSGNDLEILIDGESFLPRLAGGARAAESHVTSPAGTSRRSSRSCVKRSASVLLDLLEELARKVDVRVLLWAGAPLPLFRPSRAEVRDVAKRLRGVGVHVALDAKERPLHCHHEKLVVVDDRVASVGGSI
jgi:phosphatidylserine/phosphatidylglycerophosphate/cardiolipin synthase-like enzyme